MKHGMSKTAFYRLWKGIMERCYYKKHVNYKYYGKKGVVVCSEWHDFNNFKNSLK
jgi:hypothetical protein